MPVCRLHHREIHRHGNEAASWARAGMLPWGPYREPDPRKVKLPAEWIIKFELEFERYALRAYHDAAAARLQLNRRACKHLLQVAHSFS